MLALNCLACSGSAGFTGGERFWTGELGNKGATGGSTDGVACSTPPFEVLGRGGECFVGEKPVVAGGSAVA